MRRVKKADAAPSTRDIASEATGAPPPSEGDEPTPASSSDTVAGPTSRDVAQESAAIYPDTFDTPPTPEEIAVEAYRIYCQRGCSPGHDIQDWLEAERRLSARRRSGS